MRSDSRIENGNQSVKKIDHRGSALIRGEPDGSGVSDCCMKQAPTEIRFPIVRAMDESHFVPDSIESLEGRVVVRVEAT